MRQQHAFEPHEARVDADQIDRLFTRRAQQAHTALQHRSSREHARQATHLREDRLVEAARVPRGKLQRCGSDETVRESIDRPGEAGVGNLRCKQERNSDSDAYHGEQLLHKACAQTHTVQVGNRREPHGPISGMPVRSAPMEPLR